MKEWTICTFPFLCYFLSIIIGTKNDFRKKKIIRVRGFVSCFYMEIGIKSLKKKGDNNEKRKED